MNIGRSLMDSISKNFDDFYSVVSTGVFVPPKQIVSDGMHYTLMEDNTPVASCRLRPYHKRDGSLIAYCICNGFVLESHRGNRKFEKLIKTIAKDLKGFKIFCRIDSLGLKKYYESCFSQSSHDTEEFEKILFVETGYQKQDDHVMLLFEVN